jgi:hypothetical protein
MQQFFFPGTMVYNPDTFENNPLLEVDSSDLSVRHLQPDFVDNIYFPSENGASGSLMNDYWGNLIFGYI